MIECHVVCFVCNCMYIYLRSVNRLKTDVDKLHVYVFKRKHTCGNYRLLLYKYQCHTLLMSVY